MIEFHHVQNKNTQFQTIKIGNKVSGYSNSTKWLDEHVNSFTHIQTLSLKLSKLCFALRLVRKRISMDTTLVL